jgi:hypothetical protein
VRVAAARAGDLAAIEYTLSMQPAASAAQLTEMLNAAGFLSNFAAAQWLRQQGAEWPKQLRFGSFIWGMDNVQCARDQGCTSRILS